MLVRALGYFLLMVVVAAIAVAVAVFQFQQPMEEGKKRVDQEMEELRRKKERGQRAQRDIKELEEKVREKKREIVTFLKEKTKDRDINRFLNDMEVYSQDSGATLKQIRINPKISKQLYSEVQMDFGVEATYFEFYDLLTRIENGGMLNFSQSELTITGGGVDRGVKVKDLEEQTTRRTNLTDVNGKPVELKTYTKETEFPKLRVQFNGKLILIDSSHITRYEGS